MRFAVDRLDHLVLSVKDVDVSAAWYQRVLGMEVETYGRDHRTALKFGGQKINLRPTDTDEHSWVAARTPMASAITTTPATTRLRISFDFCAFIGWFPFLPRSSGPW